MSGTTCAPLTCERQPWAHACMHSWGHACMHSGAHACMPSGGHACMPSGAHACMHSGAHACMPSGAHACMPSGAHACMPSGAHACMHSGASAPEDGGVSGQRPLGVEAHAVKVGLVGAALDKRARAHALGRRGAVAELGGELGRGAISDDEAAAGDLAAVGRGDCPQASLLVERGADDLKALLEVGTRALRTTRDAHVHVDALYCAARRLAQLSLGCADVRGAVG
eukprot:249121-Chlamydomonas_euryale.AAC.12